MEAYPFCDEIAIILSNYYFTINQKGALENLPGLSIIEQIRDPVELALNSQPDDAGLLEKFKKEPDDLNLLNEFGSRLKRYVSSRPVEADKLQILVKEYRTLPIQSTSNNVIIQWGGSTVTGSTAQVKQDRKIEVDTIDLSKFTKFIEDS